MKVFWIDREGIPAPKNATFDWRPFSKKGISPLLSSTKQERIEKLPPPAFGIPVLDRTLTPAKEAWMQGVEKALAAIRSHHLEKVVLARSCTLELKEEPDPFAIAAALKQKAEGAFIFCFQSETTSFLGATPERLFARKKGQILSEAMAGTRKRGKTAEEDEYFRTELLASGKDIREFSPVRSYLQEILSPLCLFPVEFTPLSVHRTQNVQHLYSRCAGTLKSSVTDEEILERLHPTPALCGVPKGAAWNWIEESEPFTRGLYGGTVGWSTPDASEWVVGIRSCLIRGKTAILYSGTGIVEGSKGEEEWDELDQKLKLYDGIFL